MNSEPNYQNNPLHGVSLKQLVSEIVNHYGYEILYAYLNINCFKTNPSIEAAVKFLKKADWAREKVEGFYLYQFKSLPRASAEQFELPPRDRIVPPEQQPGPPAELSLEDAERLREKRARKAAAHDRDGGRRPQPEGRPRSDSRSDSRSAPRADSRAEPRRAPATASDDPWAKWKK